MPLSCTATYKLDELKQLGITPTPLEIVTLNDLGLAVDNAGASVMLKERGLPISIGGARLWTMTCEGSDTWENWSGWFSTSATLSTLALAFILAHGRGEPVKIRTSARILSGLSTLKPCGHPQRLSEIIDRPTALACILSWFSSLTCTLAELDAATTRLLVHQEASMRSVATQAVLVLMDRYQNTPDIYKSLSGVLDDLTAQDKEPSKAYESLTWVQYCNELAILTGTDPLYWYHSDRRETVRCYALAVEHDATAAGGSTGVLSPTEKAIKAMQAEVADIIKRHTKSPESI
jgi:hypothetical protein